MNNSIFETKEQYLAFRAAFAAAQNDERAKKYFTEKTFTSYDWKTRESKGWLGKEKHNGWLQAEHFIILNAARGKPLIRGFSPITSKNKLSSFQSNPMYAFDGALKYLRRIQNDARELINPPEIKISPYEFKLYNKMTEEQIKQEKAETLKTRATNSVNGLLEPFAGTITIEQFASLNLGE